MSGGDRALDDPLAWPCQKLDSGQDDQQHESQADDDLARWSTPEHEGQARQRDRADPQYPPVGVDPGPDGAGAEAGTFGAAPHSIGTVKLASARASNDPELNARTAGVYWRAEPEDMAVMDGPDDRKRAELISERLGRWKALSGV